MDTAQTPIPTPTPVQTQPVTPPMPEQKHPFWQHMSKGTLILIFILLVVTGGLVYLAIRQEHPLPTPKPTTATPTQKVSHAFSTLSFVEQPATGSAANTVAIHVESNQNSISGAQLNISYDPKILGNVSIQLGNYFTNPSVLLKTVDATNGQITLVLGIQPNSQQASGSGTIATISYTMLPNTATATTLHFLPKTALTQEGELESVLKTATDMTIHMARPGQPTAAASGSAH